MAAVLGGAWVSEHAARHHAEAEGIAEFAIGQQARIGSDGGGAKLERQSAVEIEPENAIKMMRAVPVSRITSCRWLFSLVQDSPPALACPREGTQTSDAALRRWSSSFRRRFPLPAWARPTGE